MTFTFDLIQTVGIAVMVYMLGLFIKNRMSFLRTYFIPAPVIGGLLCSLLVFLGVQMGWFTVEFDMVLMDFFMNVFFTVIGFTCSFAVIKTSGKLGAILAAVAVAFLVVQNLVGAGLASLFGINPLLGIAMGSISMSGGVGSGAAFGPTLEAAGADGATAIGIAAATFGLMLGSLVGGPVAKRLIKRHQLTAQNQHVEVASESIPQGGTAVAEKRETKTLSEKRIFMAVVLVLIAAFVGSYVSWLLNLTGLNFPYYVGCLFGGLIFRNIADARKFTLDLPEINIVGNCSLNLFLSLALMSLSISSLVSLAIPMIVILLAQAVVMALWATFVTFRTMGKNYNAAVMAAGHSGVSLGQTPNAIANMTAIIEEHGPAPVAWVVLPVITVVFINIANPLVITAFINLLS